MLLTYAVNRVILQNINGICHKRAERGEYDAKAQKVPKGVPDAADKGISSFGQSLRMGYRARKVSRQADPKPRGNPDSPLPDPKFRIQRIIQQPHLTSLFR